MSGIRKCFGSFTALDGVQLTLWPGEVHALMGENGAGKSTLMKILAGAETADAGAIRIAGQPVTLGHPQRARAAGIAIIHQELHVAGNLSAAENVFLGAEPRRAGWLPDRARMRRDTAALLDGLGARFGPDQRVSDLTVAEQQLVEIARALRDRSRILIMDEPTAALSVRETERLFAVVRRLRGEGLAIVYISHRMDEIDELADRVTVLRDGRYVGSLQRPRDDAGSAAAPPEQAEFSAERLVQMMVGRSIEQVFHREPSTGRGPVVLEARALTDGGKVQPTSLRLHAGEIVGLAGLVGAGRTELARLLFGAAAATGGTLALHGRPLTLSHPADAVAAGIGYVPEDRKDQGLFLDMSVRDNIALNVLPRLSRRGALSPGAREQVARDAVARLGIRVPGLSALARQLSGGNQQKLLLARWLAIRPAVLILDEPTRGVDIGAKEEIHRLLASLVSRGVAILLISSELPEVIGMSDRVLVMRLGAIAAELDGTPGQEISQEHIMAFATGALPPVCRGR
jgi:ribose transport system ATP-binding protein